MPDESKSDSVGSTMRLINEAWLAGRVDDLVPLVHPDVVMTIPDFGARVQGREAFLSGFRDFCENARVHDFQEHDQEVDAFAHTAVLTFRYEMVYERSGQRYRATGNDLWVFEKDDERWVTVWRMMHGMQEAPV